MSSKESEFPDGLALRTCQLPNNSYLNTLSEIQAEITLPCGNGGSKAEIK